MNEAKPSKVTVDLDTMGSPLNTAMGPLINLLNYDRPGLKKLFEQLGERSFHGDQVFKWLHQHGVTDFDAMTNLSKSLRQRLKQVATVRLPVIALEKKSNDGTIKWLMRLVGGNCIESVFIPEAERGTLCISSQIGCALDCKFCATGKQGFNRNLSISEIIGQVWVAVRRLSSIGGKHDRHITNVVMMGMGEPLLNFESVVPAMDMMMDDLGYGLSKYRVTLSTSGVVPGMKRLSKESDASLVLSLHAPNDELRSQIVPLNKKYPIKELMDVCRDYYGEGSKRQVTMSYVMLADVNDSPRYAKQLVKILQGVPAKVNLIPFNPFSGGLYQSSSPERIEAFREILVRSGMNTMIRKTRGEDIDAACGQLVGKVVDRTRRSRTASVKIDAIQKMAIKKTAKAGPNKTKE